MNVTIQHKADFGNPNDTGNGKMILRNVPDAATFSDAVYVGANFFSELSSNGIIGTNVGNVSAGYRYPGNPSTPPANSNIDEKLVVIYKQTAMQEPAQFTLSGVNPACLWASLEPEGLRLNQTGKDVIAGAIEALYGYTAGSVTVYEGIFLRAN